MLDKKISRRELIMATGNIAGLTALSAGLGLGMHVLDVKDPAVNPQKQFLISVLEKHAGGAKNITPLHFEAFAFRFTEEYGVVDYQKLFSGFFGEYRLTKIFLKSVIRHV